MSSWFVYILACKDGTYYTGVTTDLDRRLTEHNGGGGVKHGAKYTQARRPVRLVYYEEALNRSVAQQREYALRHSSRKEKEALISSVKLTQKN